ncbi:MAG: GlcNAc-transferase family protein [Rhodocyclaceae bacterium]|nr:GlcNAc-transferase family protein [Rhodocyclaceae bacterium]
MAEFAGTKQLTIFVSVASYRDPETPPTLADLYAKASFPERIFCGVLWQLVPGEDDDCRVLAEHVPQRQIRSREVHPKDSLGACWARHRILTELREDEAFVLQIDSHMRFVDGWDEKLLAMWRDCQSERAVLSTYPVAYVPPDELGAKAITILHPAQFNHRGILTFKARSDSYALRTERPTPNAFVCAGFLFGPKAAFDEVPYDPYLYFHGEEISLSARFWTHGWNPFTPNDVLIYHYYGRSEQRPRHWADNPAWGNLDSRSLSRLRHLFGIEKSTDPGVIEAIDHYGLGQARTLGEYQRYADVDLINQKIGPLSAAGRYPPHPQPQALALTRIFQQIYETNVWACVESRSGPGATRAATRNVVRDLRAFFAQNSVLTVLDAGCGDANWVCEATADLTHYFGVDLIPEMIHQNIRLHGHRPGHFFGVADVCQDALPKVDAIICRHVLTHLPGAQIRRALQNFKQTGARWLLATGYHDAENSDTKPGFWRRIDLTRSPFDLPEPMLKIADGNTCWLGVWRLDQHG